MAYSIIACYLVKLGSFKIDMITYTYFISRVSNYCKTDTNEKALTVIPLVLETSRT